MTKIKAIIFDVDGVLVDSFEANLKFFQDLMAGSGYNPPSREKYKSLFHNTMLDVIKILTRSDSEEEIKRIFEMGYKREVKYPIELLRSPDKMEEIIDCLFKKYSLGIVTNRVKKGVFESPTMKQIQKYFKEVISFEDTVNHKPNPEPLFLIADKLGVKPEEVVYIGDSRTDIQAANSAGMKFILFPKSDLEGVDVFSTDIFQELPELIKTLG